LQKPGSARIARNDRTERVADRGRRRRSVGGSRAEHGLSISFGAGPWRGGRDAPSVLAGPVARTKWRGDRDDALSASVHWTTAEGAGPSAGIDRNGSGRAAGGEEVFRRQIAAGWREVHGRKNDFASRGCGDAGKRLRSGVFWVSAASSGQPWIKARGPSCRRK